MIITGNADDFIKEIKLQMSQVFEMKDLRSLHYCLGLKYGETLEKLFLLKRSMPEVYSKSSGWSSVSQHQHHCNRI